MTRKNKFFYSPQLKKGAFVNPPPTVSVPQTSVDFLIPQPKLQHARPIPYRQVSTDISTTFDCSTPGDVWKANIKESTASPQELQLLDDQSLGSCGRSKDHERRTAPILTRDAYVVSGYVDHATQYGVLGRAISIHLKENVDIPHDPRLYVNTNAPFSAVVCGVQGSGKSHTVSVLLENMLIPNCCQIGSLVKPLCGLVLHFGEGGPTSRPSEASWVGVPSLPGLQTPSVHIYVSRSSLNTMRRVYAPLGENVTVVPLVFDESELDAASFLSMMSVGTSESAPLYIQIVLSILRELGENFTFQAFTADLEARARDFNPAQVAGLKQRMSLLDSFLDRSPTRTQQSYPRFAAGQLTIIDLSDPFIDSASACGLFEIITRLFVRADVGTGKVLVVDEAHKYLAANKGTSGLTKSLLTFTREQRHLGMRVIISTQEPTVVPAVLLDLCSVAIIHRFASPSWWDHVAKHVSADLSAEDVFDKVAMLQTGEAIVLAPSGLAVLRETDSTADITPRSLTSLGRRYLLLKTRKRVTADGGASVMVLGS